MNFMSAAGRSGFYEEITSSSSTSSFHHHRRPEEEEESDEVVQREHMFDKVVTPSDVGKLNRLVIPKQHAEKYFPLDSSTNEKGLLLNFEDRNGKPWRFRYSYWNSSQSYVMTKGWSRFVKEKKLDAGDIVTFQRGVGELAKDRLFIDWRRRPDAPELPISMPHHQFSSFHRSIHPWSPLYNIQQQQQQQYHIPSSYNYNYNYNPCHPPPPPPPPPLGSSIVYLRGGPPGGAGGGPAQRVFDSVPVVQGKATAKRLRLFGVNMDCPIEECDILSSSTVPTMPLHHRLDSSSSSRTNYSTTVTDDPAADYNNNKGKGSMSLDLDI